MNVEKTIENIIAKCDNYIDPQLAVCIIRDNYTMGSNNIDELKKYDIENEGKKLSKETFDQIVEGRETFHRAFMTGAMTARGNLKTLRMLDEIFNFQK